MNLYEYQAKKILSKHKIKIPLGYVCFSTDEIETAISKIRNNSWVAKCQIHAGNRGKSGGICITKNPKKIISFSKKWLGKSLTTKQTNLFGKKVKSILIEENIKIKQELYLSIIIDYKIHSIVLIASMKGGINVEEDFKNHPELMQKIYIDLYSEIPHYKFRELACKLKIPNEKIVNFSDICFRLISIFIKYDFLMLEINPLAITEKKDFVCIDSKIFIDENAKFRQKKLYEKIFNFQNKSKEINYIRLKGNIGCIVNGAGLAMSTMDIIQLYGGKPANFLDIGGNTSKEKIKKSFNIILSNTSVKVILVNIFGGIVRCDLVADSIINCINQIKISIPIVVRLEGTFSEIALNKIKKSNLNIFTENNIKNAVKKAVKISK